MGARTLIVLLLSAVSAFAQFSFRPAITAETQRRGQAFGGTGARLTLLYQRSQSIATNTSYAFSPATVDLDSNRYVVEWDRASFAAGSEVNGAVVSIGNSGYTAKINLVNSTTLGGGGFYMLEGDASNFQDFISSSYSASNLWTPSAATEYNLKIEIGLGQGHAYNAGYPQFTNGSASRLAVMMYQRAATTTARPNPASLVQLYSGNGTTRGLRLWRREMADVTNLVMLGDSITKSYVFEAALRTALGPWYFVTNNGVGYRQSREMKNAIASPFPGDAYNPANYYPDIAAGTTGVAQFRTGAKANIAIIGIGTNDILWYNASGTAGKGTPNGANQDGPEDGGATASSIITNITDAIAAIGSANGGWKVYVRTPLNIKASVLAAGGSYGPAETMRQDVITDIRSGAISTAALATGGGIIDIENLFAPTASRTDDVASDGPMYSGTYWPPSASGTGYANNTTWITDGIHPTAAGYQQIATYIAARVQCPSAITPSTMTGTAGTPISQQFTATNDAAGWYATGLPSGLSMGTSGILSGTPAASGTANATIKSFNSFGTSSRVVPFTISAATLDAPMITGGTATLTQNMTYTATYPAWDIIATGTPSGYGATGTPGGLYISSSQLLGTPTGTGTTTVTLSATNAAGTGTNGLTVIVNPPSTGRTFYVDYDTGSDTASGTSKSQPWKMAPIMALGTGSVGSYYSFGGSYTHQAGDRFIFKGGVTWPRPYMYFSSSYQGTAGNRDYYGIDPTWYSGGSWTKPVLDGQHVDKWMVDFATATGYLEFEGIHFKKVAFGSDADVNRAIISYSANARDVVFRNIKVSDWTVATGLDGSHGGMTGFASIGTNQQTILFDGVEIENSAQSGSGNCLRYGGVLRRCRFHDNSSAVLYAIEMDGCEVYNIDGVANDGSYHPNGFYADPGAFTGLASVTIKNSIFRDVGGGANMAYPQPRGGGVCYVYNNLFYGTMSAQGAIEADPYNYGSGNQTGVLHVYNNTIVLDTAQFPSGGNGIIFVDRTSEGSKVGTAHVFNNHVIGASGSALSNQSGTYVVAFNSGNNVIETAAQAGTAGAVSPFYRATTGPTVATGSSISGTFANDRLYRTRSGTWDIGAYRQ